MRRRAATMRLLALLAAACCLAGLAEARPQRAAPGPHMHHNAQLSGAAANSMAPLTSEWRDESVRRLSSGPEGSDEVALSQSPYAWKPLVSESRRVRPSSRTSRDQQQQQQPSSEGEAPAEPLPAAEALKSEPVTAPSALSSPSAPSSPSSPSSPSAPTAPTGASPIGESLKEVASQLISATAEDAPPAPQALIAAKPIVEEVHDIRTPPIVKIQDLRKPDVPKPVMVSATVSTTQDMDDHTGFQGVAEPVVLADEHLPTMPQATAEATAEALPQALPQHMPLRTAPQPAVAAPQHHPVQHHAVPHREVPHRDVPHRDAPHHAPPHHTPSHHAAPAQPASSVQAHPVLQQQAELVKKAGIAGNASSPLGAAPMTTAEPQPSTTASDRISTWILLSGTHSTATTPSSLKKAGAGPGQALGQSVGQALGQPPQAAGKVPNAKPAQAARPPPARKPGHGPGQGQQRNPARKPAPTATPAAAPTTASPTSTTSKPIPATSSAPSAPSAPQQTPEYVKISEAVVSTASGSGLVHSNKDKPADRKPQRPAAVPAVHTESKQVVKRPIHAQQAQQDKTKVSSASVPFNTAIAFRRKPVPGQALPRPAALKTPAPTTTTTTTTTTAAPAEELTTLPPTLADLAVTTDADLVTTTLPPVTTKKPKRSGSSASKKKKKKNKNKTRRRRPTKKTSASAVSAESKIGHEGNATKLVAGPGGPGVGQNGISTKIYNYLAREVMPSVSVGIIGLVVTAGLAGLFLYPFGGGIAARRTYDTAPHQRYPGPGGEQMYYYESYPDQQQGVQVADGSSGKPEEEVLGQVFSGMQQDRDRQGVQGVQGAQGTQDTRFAASPQIYGGGDSGPPDAQYPDVYSRYDSNGKGSSYRPAADAGPSSDLRQGTGYSSVSVNGQGQVTGYADPSPAGQAGQGASVPAVQVESKFEPLGTLDALQRTRYDVDTPIADQVDLTYAAVGESGPSPSKKGEDSPYVVGSPEAQQGAQGAQGGQNTRYHEDSDAASHVDITYGSSGSGNSGSAAGDQDAKEPSYSAEPKPSNRYSVRLSGGSGQVALAYGSGSASVDQDASGKLDQGASSVDLTYGAGLDMDGRYATANGAQPRSLHEAEKQGRIIIKEVKATAKQTERRRRRRSAGDVDDDLNNEIDGPVPASAAADKRQPSTATVSASDDAMAAVTTVDTMTTTEVEQDDKKDVVTDPVTTILNTNDPLFNLANDVMGMVGNGVSSSSSNDLRDTLASTTTTAAPELPGGASNGTSPAEDALSTLINIFRRVAEFKLRVGMNLLRGTSEAVTRYIGGVTKRMEAAAEHLHHMRSERSERSERTARAHSQLNSVEPQTTSLRRRVRDVSRGKQQVKKILLKSNKNKKEH